MLHSTEWVYKRGWRALDQVDTAESLRAKDQLRLWGYVFRWRKFPQLGPPPAAWLRFGEPPDGVTLFGAILLAYMSAPIIEQINSPNTLLALVSQPTEIRSKSPNSDEPVTET